VLGPFPTSEYVNEYVVNSTHYFSKWTELLAMKNADTLTMA